MALNDNWTPAQREQLLRDVHEQAVLQIEGDPELREMVDWMISAVGLQPSTEIYRLVFMTSVMVTMGLGEGA